MSTTAPAPTNGHHRKLDGVRTYRGRKLEDLIPKIRAELGPDAIILREREGLMGGINGFFAQRFVEVEARAGTPRVDVYDDEDDLDTPTAAPAPPAAATPPTAPPAPPAKRAAPPDPPAATTPPPVSAPSAMSADLGLSPAESFARQLEEAAATAFDDLAIEPEPEPEPEPVAPEPVPQAVAPAPEPPAQEPQAVVPEPIVPEPIVPEPIVPEPIVPEPEPAPVAEKPAPVQPKRSPARKPRRGPSGRFTRTRTAEPATDVGAQPDTSVPAAVARELVAAGISDAWAHQLIGEAGAHATPFARQGGLRSAVRGALAGSIVHARPLPATGAAVAFVGAGGAGKTRCVATLAAAYKRASTLTVSAISLGSADNGRELAKLLRPQGVSVAAGKSGEGIARRVEKGRHGGLVVIDTPAVAPSDSVAVHALVAELEPLGLDAIYVVLPATLGARTGKRLLSGLAPLQPTGLAISHADETDQLGIAAELAYATRIPVSYIHEGLDIETALTATDPMDLAARLLS